MFASVGSEHCALAASERPMQILPTGGCPMAGFLPVVDTKSTKGSAIRTEVVGHYLLNVVMPLKFF